MNHSTWSEYRWNASACVRVRLHWRPLRVWLHSSFQQSTMGNWELLHHLAVLVCFVAESWPVSLLSLSLPPSLCVFISIFYYSHSSFSFIQWWQSTPKSNCITSRMHLQHEALVLLPPPGWKSQEDRRFTLRSCITPSYLGQWCMFMLVNAVVMLSNSHRKKKCKEMRR